MEMPTKLIYIFSGGQETIKLCRSCGYQDISLKEYFQNNEEKLSKFDRLSFKGLLERKLPARILFKDGEEQALIYFRRTAKEIH